MLPKKTREKAVEKRFANACLYSWHPNLWSVLGMRLPLQFLELFFFCRQLFLQFTEAKKKNRCDLTESGEKSSSLVWSPPMQLLFVGAAPLLPGSGRQTIRFDCCVRIKRNYSRSMLSSELFGGCLRCWLHLVGLHWPKKNDRSVMILWC